MSRRKLQPTADVMREQLALAAQAQIDRATEAADTRRMLPAVFALGGLCGSLLPPLVQWVLS